MAAYRLQRLTCGMKRHLVRRRLARLARLTVVAIAAMTLGIACGRAGDAAGPTVELEQLDEPPLPDVTFLTPVAETSPKRIVSLIPSVTEHLFALGFGDRIVGIDRWADYPPAVKSLPRLADLEKVEVERILDLRPDLVVCFSSHEDEAKLMRQAGIEVLIPATETADDIEASLTMLGRVLQTPKRSARLWHHLDDRIRQISRQTRDPRPRVLTVFDRSPFSVPTKSSFVHYMIEAAGGINVAAEADSKQSFVYVDSERVLEWDPDVIIDLSVGSDAGAIVEEAQRVWRSLGVLRAYREGKIRLVQAPSLSRPGPRVAASIEILARLIRGEDG